MYVWMIPNTSLKKYSRKTQDVAKWILTGPIIVACQWNTETEKQRNW